MVIGPQPLEQLEPTSAMLRPVKRGTLNTPGRVRESVSAFFRYAIATGRAKRDPATDLRDALPKADATTFAALTEQHGMAELLYAIDGFQGHAVTLAALKLSSLVFRHPANCGRWNGPTLTSAAPNGRSRRGVGRSGRPQRRTRGRTNPWRNSRDIQWQSPSVAMRLQRKGPPHGHQGQNITRRCQATNDPGGDR